MSSKPDQVRLKHLLDAARKISQFCHGVPKTTFLEDEKLQLAVVRLLEIAGEAANSIFRVTQGRTPPKSPGNKSLIHVTGLSMVTLMWI